MQCAVSRPGKRALPHGQLALADPQDRRVHKARNRVIRQANTHGHMCDRKHLHDPGGIHLEGHRVPEHQKAVPGDAEEDQKQQPERKPAPRNRQLWPPLVNFYPARQRHLGPPAGRCRTRANLIRKAKHRMTRAALGDRQLDINIICQNRLATGFAVELHGVYFGGSWRAFPGKEGCAGATGARLTSEGTTANATMYRPLPKAYAPRSKISQTALEFTSGANHSHTT